MTFRIGLRTYIYFYKSGVYFRIRGRGLSLEIDRPRYFSERHGLKKVLRVGRLAIERLK